MKEGIGRGVIVLIISVLFFGCNIFSSGAAEKADFVGTVENSRGNVLEDAEVHIEYEGVDMGESSGYYYYFSMHRRGDLIHAPEVGTLKKKVYIKESPQRVQFRY